MSTLTAPDLAALSARAIRRVARCRADQDAAPLREQAARWVDRLAAARPDVADPNEADALRRAPAWQTAEKLETWADRLAVWALERSP